ncbi:polysaccharide pyruvyl transferase family protein [Aerococcus sp. L_4]
MKILLISRFNVPNIGDLAISNIMYELLSKDAEVDCFNLFGEPFVRKDINNINSVTPISKFNHSILNNKIFGKHIKNAIKTVKNRSKISSVKTLESIIDNYDGVILAGGNMMMSLDDNYDTIKKISEYVDIVKEKKKFLYFLSIGIGPFHTKEHAQLAVNTLKRADYISFRDYASQNLYINSGGDVSNSYLTVDPVFYYENENLANINNHKENKIIAINVLDTSLIGLNTEEYNNNIKSYQKIVNSLLNDKNIDWDIILFSTSLEDNKAVKDVYKIFESNLKVDNLLINGLDDLYKLYKNIDILLGTRMHSMIIAYTFLVPIIGLSWQTKIDEFFSIIDQPDDYFDLLNFEDNVEEILDIISYKIKHRDAIQQDMLLKLVEIRESGKDDSLVFNDNYDCI